METADKDYIDAKLEAVIERMNGEARAHQIAADARMKEFNQTLEFGLKSALSEGDLKQAQTEAYLQKVSNDVTKSQGEIIKWVAAISIASAAITISATTLLVMQSAPKSNTPIVIYAQPAPQVIDKPNDIRK